MRRIVTVDTVTGNVVSQWTGGDEQDLAPMVGRTHLTLAEDDAANYSGQRWNGRTFEALQAAPATETIEEQLWRIEVKLDELLSR